MNVSITSSFTQVEQTKIHYLSAGKGEVILLLHGWPTSAYLWRNIIPELAKTHHVIAIDLPGFGQSDKHIDDSYSFLYYNRIISGVLENLDLNKVTLGLHDLGGPIGLYWTIHNMKKVDKLIFLNTLVYPDFSWAVKAFGLATLLPIVRTWISSPGGIKWAMFFGVQQKHKLTKEIIIEYQKPFEKPEARKALLKSIQRLNIKGFHEIQEKLPSFNGPVQIIYGEKDRILPSVKTTMERVKKDLPQSTIISLPNCGHFIQEEEPQKISEIIASFVAAKA